MIGEAVANGAISLVNAIASGRGATVGVDLRTEAKVEIVEGRGPWEVSFNDRPSDSPLVIETVRRAAIASGLEPSRCHGFAETRTAIPVGVGLKSSSSAAVAVAMAVFDAVGGRGVTDRTILKCCVEASLASGTSITGALDDAASCLLGGVNLADNTNSKIISSRRLPRVMDVVVMVPSQGSRRRFIDLSEARRLAQASDSLVGLCRQGDYWAAMTLNGLLYSGLLGYKSHTAVMAMKLGACGAGLSGTGPSVAAVFDSRHSEEIQRLVDAWSGNGAKVVRTRTSNRRARFLD